jgi:hypothetical protein
MCLICSELAKNNLTIIEARRNLGEMYRDMEKDHIHEVLRLIWKKEDEEYNEYESIMDYGSD